MVLHRKQILQIQTPHYSNFCYDRNYILELQALRTRNAVNSAATIQNPHTCKLCEHKPDTPL